MVPAQILNDVVLKKLDTDPDNVNKSALAYAREKLRFLNPEVRDLKVSFQQEAGLVSFLVGGTINGERKGGEKTWTKMQLLATTVPITHFMDDLLKDVFEVPSEGTSVS